MGGSAGDALVDAKTRALMEAMDFRAGGAMAKAEVAMAKEAEEGSVGL